MKNALRAAVLAFASMVFLLGSATATDFDKPTDIIRLRYRNLFLGKDAGTVAFLPGIGDANFAIGAHEFWILPVSGDYYDLPARGNYVFEVANVSGESEPRLLQCIIYTIYPKGGAQKPPILLNRNEAEWLGGEYGDHKPRSTPTTVIRKRLDGDNIIALFHEKHKGDDLKVVDDFMGTTWHAWVESNGDSSWELRGELAQDPPPNFMKLVERCGLSKEAIDICLTVHLIHFSTAEAPTRRHKRPAFEMTGDGAVGAYIRIDSPPDRQFSKEFYLRFDPKR